MSHPDEPAAPRRAGYEARDVNVTLVVAVVVVFLVLAFSLHTLLWELARLVVPESTQNGASPPVVMPGEPPVSDRLKAVPPPQLEGIGESPGIHPEDLRAGRQPRLRGYGWVDRDKGVARIPIDRAMDAVVETSRAKSGGKKGGRP